MPLGLRQQGLELQQLDPLASVSDGDWKKKWIVIKERGTANLLVSDGKELDVKGFLNKSITDFQFETILHCFPECELSVSCFEPYDCLANDGFRADQILAFKNDDYASSPREENRRPSKVADLDSDNPFRRPMIDWTLSQSTFFRLMTMLKRTSLSFPLRLLRTWS